MKIFLPRVWFVVLLAMNTASAQLEFEKTAARPLNRFALSARFGFNISADFKDSTPLRPFGSTATGPGTGGGLDRFYDDGYVRRDASGNAEGTTWFWGYDHASQVSIPDDTLTLHGTSSGGGAGTASSRGVDDDPHLGFELRYLRELAVTGPARWGLETAFGRTEIQIDDHRAVLSKARQIADSYSLGGIVPPQAPYRGSFSGPGALINDTPARTISRGSRATQGSRGVASDLYSFRLGPYVEFPLCKRCAIQLGAGLALVYLDSEFEFSHKTSAGAVMTRGRSSKTDWLPGAYAQAELSFAVTEHLSIFGGIQYQHTDDFRQRAGSQSVALNLGEALFGLAGFSFSF